MKCNIKKTKKINKTLNKLLKKWEKYKPLWNTFKEHIYYKQYIIEKQNLNFTEFDDVLEYRKTNINWNNWIEYIDIELLEKDEMRNLYHDIVFLLECKIKNKDYKLSNIKRELEIKEKTSMKYQQNNIINSEQEKRLNLVEQQPNENVVETTKLEMSGIIENIVPNKPIIGTTKPKTNIITIKPPENIVIKPPENIVKETPPNIFVTKQPENIVTKSPENIVKKTPPNIVTTKSPENIVTTKPPENIVTTKPLENIFTTTPQENIVTKKPHSTNIPIKHNVPKEELQNTKLPVIGNIRETKYIFHPFDGILINLNHY